MDLLRNYADWEDVQKLEISGWIEEVFDSTLNDPKSDWDREGEMWKETFKFCIYAAENHSAVQVTQP